MGGGKKQLRILEDPGGIKEKPRIWQRGKGYIIQRSNPQPTSDLALHFYLQVIISISCCKSPGYIIQTSPLPAPKVSSA